MRVFERYGAEPTETNESLPVGSLRLAHPTSANWGKRHMKRATTAMRKKKSGSKK